MRFYNVFMAKTGDKPIFVEEKFSFKAMLFSAFWLLYHKIWFPAITVLIIEIAIIWGLEKAVISHYLAYTLGFLVVFTVALFAKSWYIKLLKKNHYKLCLVLAAKSLDEAKLKFYQSVI